MKAHATSATAWARPIPQTADAAPDPLPYLETFAQAAERSSFTAAARGLGLTQAAVSQRIQALEKELGVSLFRRQAGRVTLTDAGRRLHGYAQRILELHDEARRVLAGHKPEVAGDLLIGASTIPGEQLLPMLLPGFRQRFPKVQVHVRIADSLAVIEQVERGQVHVGMVGQKADRPQLEFRPLATDRMVLVVPRDHPWRRQRQVTLRQLAGQPLILREPGSGSRHCFEKALEQAGRSLSDLQIVLELGSNEAVKAAVLRGLGVAVLSSYAVRPEVESGQLARLRVKDLACDRVIYVVHERRRPLPPPARSFLYDLEAHPLRAPRP